jgi:hypothetical protein
VNAAVSIPKTFKYRYSWTIVILAVVYTLLATHVKGPGPSLLTDVLVGLFLFAIYIEWKTLCVSLDESSIQSRSFFHRRELRYSDIKSVRLVVVAKGGGRSLKISGRNGSVFNVDDSLKDFYMFVALVKKLAEENGACFEEPK